MAKGMGGVIPLSHGEFNAKGECILLPPGLDPEIIIINGQKDNRGRLIMIKEIESKTYILINVYCPTKDDTKSQKNIFLNEIQELIDEYSEEDIFIWGDLNTYRKLDRDKKED